MQNLFITSQKRRGRRPLGSQASNKNKMEHKQQQLKASIEQRKTLLDSCSSESDKDDASFMPTVRPRSNLMIYYVCVQDIPLSEGFLE
jgi:hypothetical protein